MKRFRGTIWGTLLAVSLTLGTAWAQDDASPASDDKPSPSIQTEEPPPPPEGQAPLSTDADQPDPPSRVARLQYMSGSVSLQPQGTGEWVAGVVNRPLTNSDNVWTDKDSRAELNVGSGLIRMGSESSLTITDISDNSTQLELHQGALNLNVRHLEQGETYEIDTPETAFIVHTPGEYRLEVDSNGNTSEVTVRRGEGQANTNGSSVTIRAGQQARFGEDNSAAPEIAEASAPDSFDDWCRERDRRVENSASARYVSPNVVGSDDLDEYGNWRDSPDYGPVWVPTSVPDGWAPYHYGHWVWISPWGWTWVDDQPWGFAPFHYGRWVYWGGNWGWAPGPYSNWGPAYYSPALVAWFGGSGWGSGFGFGFGGGIGWCALGWGEPFFPWYHTRWGYFNRVNIYNTRIHNINRFRGGFGRPGFGAGYRYANLRSPHGPIAVSQRALTHSMPVRGMGVRMSASQFSRASLGARVPVNPSRMSRLGPGAGRATATPPSRSFSRPVVSRNGMGGARTAGRGSTPGGSFARPNVGGMNNRSAMSNRGAMAGSMGGRSAGMANGRFVPRPPQGMRGSGGMGQPGPSSGMRSNPGASSRSYSPQNFGRGNSNYVPRPNGPVRTAPNASNGYSSRYGGQNGSSRGQYGASRSYGNSPRYNTPSYGSPNRNYGSPGGNYGAQPSYRNNPGQGNRSYSAPQSHRGYSGSPSYRSYGGSQGYSGRSYSAPSNRSAPSYGGGGYSGSRSYGGGSSGGGGRSYGGGSYGGGHSSGGGSFGGGHSSGGGGGHSGGGGGHSGGGGGHGGGGRR